MKAPVDLVYISLYYVSKGEKGYYMLISVNDPIANYKIEISRAKALELRKKCHLMIQMVDEPIEAQKLQRYIELSDNKRIPGISKKNKQDYIEGYLGLYYSFNDQGYFVHILIPEPETKLYFEIKETDVKKVRQCCFIDIHLEKEVSLRPLAS